jgi:transcriptional regulator with GAF, ATPase, and Fis domain
MSGQHDTDRPDRERTTTASSEGVAHRIAAFSLALAEESDELGVLRRVVRAATEHVPGAEHASVTLLGADGLSTPAATDDLAAVLDELQYAAAEGPCLEAVTQPLVRVDDLAGDPRWPRFAVGAARLGIRSMVSLQLCVHTEVVGALNLSASAPDRFATPAEAVAVAMAAHTAVAVVSARRQANLRAALDSRDVIGQAKGILMERHRIDAGAAFAMLAAASQASNTKLRDVASTLAATGELPRKP